MCIIQYLRFKFVYIYIKGTRLHLYSEWTKEKKKSHQQKNNNFGFDNRAHDKWGERKKTVVRTSKFR